MEIRSERLVMTQLKACDRDLYYFLHSDPEIIALCFDEPSNDELEAKFEYCLPTWNRESGHWLCLTISILETNEKVGITGLKVENGVAEVGYLLLPSFYGVGYGTESLKALLHWARMNCDINEFSAVVTEGNIGSERVLEKCGFTLQRIIPNAYQIGDRMYADHCYRIINT
ncbi:MULTISPECIES: GNAT family N-acetyltransferase [Vibrio]|uniref:N-acetyltransferase n=1 Tax=Vibrio pectenicida TaxID=62763 RepID=A0A3R9FML4_9VIBR|nr:MULTISPECIES: GNAT family N-acetyltransferase [Vibrio]MBU2896146.1 GNAT family N-acetyltransferase [Vibrio hepatarius]RSD29975.1 N-acetyltransferase [Vibrio pectenicida]